MSKEHRTHETQVLLGLLIDRCGIPLDYEIYRGNTAEVKTLMKVVESFREKCPQGKPIVVADRGLNSKDNLSKLIKTTVLLSWRTVFSGSAAKSWEACLARTAGNINLIQKQERCHGR